MNDLLEIFKNGEGEYRWSTEYIHHDNEETMNDFLDYHMPCDYEVVRDDGSECDVAPKEGGKIIRLNASGDGDFCHHLLKVRAI